MKARYFVACGLMVVAVLAASEAFYPQLPSRVPMHWNARGEVNGWGSRTTFVLMMPAIMASIMLIFAALPWLSPKNFGVERFEPTYHYMMVATVGLMGYTQIVMLWRALGHAIDVGKAITGGVCLLIALLGNVMGKVRRNFFVGIRTPWTLADERVWNATHRFSAKLWTVGGLVALVLCLLLKTPLVPIAVISSLALISILYSLVFYKELQKRGEI
jgi:uncharacterized membrane protein